MLEHINQEDVKNNEILGHKWRVDEEVIPRKRLEQYGHIRKKKFLVKK